MHKINSLKRRGTAASFVLFVACSLCLHLTAAAQKFDLHDGVFKRKGCKFESGKPNGPYKLSVVDPATGSEVTRTLDGQAVPVAINGKRIYTALVAFNSTQQAADAKHLEEYLLNNLKEELSKYNGKSAVARAYLDNVIIDEKGRVVYFEYDGIKVWADGMVRELNVSIARMNKIMSNAPAMEPPTIDGKPVAAHTGIFLQDYEIEIADKNISWRNNRLGDDRGRYFKARPAK